MTEQEQSQLDAWIAAHVMGWTNGIDGHMNPAWYIGRISLRHNQWQPTIDAQDAMEVLVKCAKYLEEKNLRVEYRVDGNFHCLRSNEMGECSESAETLPEAICKFAKHLFTP